MERSAKYLLMKNRMTETKQRAACQKEIGLLNYNFYSFDLKSVINSPSSISSIKNVHL